MSLLQKRLQQVLRKPQKLPKQRMIWCAAE